MKRVLFLFVLLVLVDCGSAATSFFWDTDFYFYDYPGASNGYACIQGFTGALCHPPNLANIGHLTGSVVETIPGTLWNFTGDFFYCNGTINNDSAGWSVMHDCQNTTICATSTIVAMFNDTFVGCFLPGQPSFNILTLSSTSYRISFNANPQFAPELGVVARLAIGDWMAWDNQTQNDAPPGLRSGASSNYTLGGGVCSSLIGRAHV